jgi:hypothetical protein
MGNDLVKAANKLAGPDRRLVPANVRELDTLAMDGKGKTLDEHQQLARIQKEFTVSRTARDLLEGSLARPVVVQKPGELGAPSRVVGRLLGGAQPQLRLEGELPNPSYVAGYCIQKQGAGLLITVGSKQAHKGPVVASLAPFETSVPLPIAPGKTVHVKVVGVTGKVIAERDVSRSA